MTLYAANLADIAQPVKQRAIKQPPGVRAPKEEKPKKPRKRKVDQVEEEAIAEKQREIEAKEQEILEKKRLIAEKRKQKRLEKKAAQAVQVEKSETLSQPSLGEAVEKEIQNQLPPPQVAQKLPDEPPAWFQKYVEGVKKEEAKITKVKKPKKLVKQEAKETATNSWNDGLTRDRVQNEVDSHMAKMYSMIFTNRRMK